MTDIQPSRFRVLVDTTLNWAGDIVFLLPHQVREHHAPAETDPRPLVAATVRDADIPTTLERINDWPGTDASGEGTNIWHPEGRQQPIPEFEMTPEQMLADLKEFFKPMRDYAIYQLEQAKLPPPPVLTTRSIMAEQAAASEAVSNTDTVVADDSYGTPLGTVGPYSVVTAKGLAGEDRWDVVDASGTSTGYIGEADNSEDGAKAHAEFLNGGPVTETVHYEDGTSATGTAPLPTQSPEEQSADPKNA